MHAPTQWCIAVGSLQNPTLLGRAWKPAPTGFVRCRSCCAKSDPTRARNARPYAVVYRHWFFAESNLARTSVEARPYRVCALPFVLCKIGPYSGAQCTPLRSGVSPLVLCRIQPRSGGRGNPPLRIVHHQFAQAIREPPLRLVQILRADVGLLPYGIVCIRFLQNKIPRQTEKYCLSGGKCISVNRVNRRKDRRDRFAVSSGVRPKPVQISLCPFHSPCRVRAWLQSRYPPYACRHFLFRPLCR